MARMGTAVDSTTGSGCCGSTGRYARPYGLPAGPTSYATNPPISAPTGAPTGCPAQPRSNGKINIDGPGQPAREGPPGNNDGSGMETDRRKSILYIGALTVTPPGTCQPGTRPTGPGEEPEPTDTTKSEAPLRVRPRGCRGPCGHPCIRTAPPEHTQRRFGGVLRGTTQKAAIPVGYGPLSELGSTHPRRQDDNHPTYRDRPTGNPGGAAFGCWPSRGPRPPYNGAQMPQPPGPPPRRDSLRKVLGSQKGAARATGPTPHLLQGRPTGETSKGD